MPVRVRARADTKKAEEEEEKEAEFEFDDGDEKEVEKVSRRRGKKPSAALEDINGEDAKPSRRRGRKKAAADDEDSEEEELKPPQRRGTKKRTLMDDSDQDEEDDKRVRQRDKAENNEKKPAKKREDNEGQKKGMKRSLAAPEDSNAMPRNAERKFSLYVDSKGSWVLDPVDSSLHIASDVVTQKEVDRADRLANDEVKSLVAKMVRYCLFRGSKKLPIVKAKLNEHVMGNYKKSRITNFVFGEAQNLLRAIWGYDLVPAPPRDARGTSFPGQLDDSWFLVVDKELWSLDHAELLAMDLDDQECRERAFLMVCFSAIVSASGALEENDLYRALAKVDPSIEECSRKKGGKPIPGLQANIADLLDKVTREQHYLLKTVEDGKNYYHLGPRALVEVGRFQMIQFQADALGERLEPTLISELEEKSQAKDDDDDADDNRDNAPEQPQVRQ